MKRRSRLSPERLDEELSRLKQENRDSLVRRWVALFSTNPPPRTSRPLLMRAVAYRLQERAYGGLPAAIRRVLTTNSQTGLSRKPSLHPSTGTALLREWRGKTHQVTIGEHGVLYSGKSYRSLSEVARIITGTRWSGPAFFGLKKNDQDKTDG